MRTITATELKENLGKYLKLGENEVIKITRRGKVILSIVPEKERLEEELISIFGSVPREAIKAIDGKIQGYICSSQLTDIYYVLRKYVDEATKRKIIRAVLSSFTVLPLLPSFTSYCVDSDMEDYEDAILDEVAKVNMINYLVTNDEKDFQKAKSTIITPKNLDLLISAAEGTN